MKANNIKLNNDNVIHYFYPMSLLKLVIMQIMTLGAYQLFWWYKQWTSIKEAEKTKIKPPVRSVLSLFFYIPFIMRAYSSNKGSRLFLISMFFTIQIITICTLHIKGISQILVSTILLLMLTLNYVLIQMKINKLYFKDKPPSIETNFSFNFSSYLCMAMGIVGWFFWVMGILEGL